jgi:hypothetical protein
VNTLPSSPSLIAAGLPLPLPPPPPPPPNQLLDLPKVWALKPPNDIPLGYACGTSAPNGIRLPARCHFTGPKISRAQPLPLALLMYLHASKTLCASCIVHRCIYSYFAISILKNYLILVEKYGFLAYTLFVSYIFAQFFLSKPRNLNLSS